MRARLKCVLIFINTSLYCLAETHEYKWIQRSTQDTSYIQEKKRITRQSGYVYNRPNIPFNLPVRDNLVTPTIQASPVDRTVMQMYYAYPTPARGIATGIAVGTSTASKGYSSGLPSGRDTSKTNIKSSSATESGVYNYIAPIVSQTNQQIPPTITSEATLNLDEFKNRVQAVSRKSIGESMTPENNQDSLINSLNSSDGYTYRAPTTAINKEMSTQADIPPNIDSDAGGYNYGAQNNFVEKGSDGGSSSIKKTAKNTESDSSLTSSGYDYNKQNTAVSQTDLRVDAARSTEGSAGVDTKSSSDGYNYSTPNEFQGVIESSSVSKTPGYSIISPPQSTPITTVSVSTNAPQYLPPASNTNNKLSNNNLNTGLLLTTSKLTTTQTASDVPPVTNTALSDLYLAPVSSAAFNKAVSNTKSVVGSEYSNVYLPPMGSSNPPATSEDIQATFANTQPSPNSYAPDSFLDPSGNPKNTYLQPSPELVVSKPKIQTTVTVTTQPATIPSSNYLQNIPTSREINQLILSTPAATYLPPLL